MKTKLVLLIAVVFLLFINVNAFGKELYGTSDTIPQPIFRIVSKNSEYPEGDTAWKSFLQNELNPDVAVKNGARPGTYTVFIQFIITPDGLVDDVRPLSRVGYGMEEEAVRVIKKSKKWEPAIENGRYVKAYRKQPITFTVSETTKERIKFSDLFPKHKK